MTDETPFEDRHRCRASYRPFGGIADGLVRLDEALSAIERARASGDAIRTRLQLAEDSTVLVEGSAPYTTLYGTNSDAVAVTDESAFRPLCDLSAFWRIWRPPAALLGPADRQWLADRGLARDPAPPLPARWHREHGWRDMPAERLPDIVAATRAAAHAARDAKRQKGAA